MTVCLIGPLWATVCGVGEVTQGGRAAVEAAVDIDDSVRLVKLGLRRKRMSLLFLCQGGHEGAFWDWWTVYDYVLEFSALKKGTLNGMAR